MEAMKLQVRRNDFSDDCTIGDLSIDGVVFCNTLEDVDRHLETNPNAKIFGQTAIPRGTYRVTISYSDHFQRDLPLLSGVVGFSGVRIHPGNSDADTEGCILVGIKSDRDDWITNSRATFEPLFDQIHNAIENGEEVWITVL